MAELRGIASLFVVNLLAACVAGYSTGHNVSEALYWPLIQMDLDEFCTTDACKPPAVVQKNVAFSNEVEPWGNITNMEPGVLISINCLGTTCTEADGAQRSLTFMGYEGDAPRPISSDDYDAVFVTSNKAALAGLANNASCHSVDLVALFRSGDQYSPACMGMGVGYPCSQGCTDLLKQLGPDCFEDTAAQFMSVNGIEEYSGGLPANAEALYKQCVAGEKLQPVTGRNAALLGSAPQGVAVTVALLLASLVAIWH